jgi:hypothetical protein
MDTLYLDPSAWDLALDASGNIAVASAPYALAQDAASAIQTFQGECWYDTTIGVPYNTDILGKRPPVELMKAQFVAAAMTVPGVVSATVSLNLSDRSLTGTVTITDTTGATATATF